MTVLYDVLTIKKLENLTESQKRQFISEIIICGKYEYFDKFKGIFDKDITEVIDSDEILKLLPMIIDSELLEFVLDNYEFKQGQYFFYNYALHNDNSKIKEIVYNYFVDNFSHIMIDKMAKYEALLEK